MNRQAIFDKVAKHLLKQNKESSLKGELVCAYRGKGDTKCAIGCLIPEKLYTPNMERRAVRALCEQYPAFAKHIGATKRDYVFLSNLQHIHDGSEPGNWHKELSIFAKKNRLEFDQ